MPQPGEDDRWGPEACYLTWARGGRSSVLVVPEIVGEGVCFASRTELLQSRHGGIVTTQSADPTTSSSPCTADENPGMAGGDSPSIGY